MPQIGERIFVQGGNQKYCGLTNEELIRYIGTDWTSLRIGLLCAMNLNGTSTVAGRLAIGVCSGSTNPMGAASTTLFCGMLTQGDLTYNANSGNPYFSQGSAYGLRRVNNTNTTAGVGTTNMYLTSTDGSLQRRSLVFIDLNKGGSSNVVVFSNPTTQFNIDFSFAHFLEGLEYPSNPAVQGISLQSTSAQTVSFSETPGSLDHVDVRWSGLSQALEIYAWGVWRKS
jgi:hypothetical protein